MRAIGRLIFAGVVRKPRIWAFEFRMRVFV
jgi:hypothetical protein